MTDPDILKALGPLAPLYSDLAVREIMVDAPERVLVERKGQLQDAGVTFRSEAALREVMEALLALGGLKLAAGQTIGDTRLPDGARLLAIYPPTAPNGPYLVIRKMFVTRLSWEQLIEWDVITPAMQELLRQACRAHVNMLVAGGPGSGKTTFANLLTELIPAEERLVVVEEAKELQVRHARTIYLESAAPANVPIDELLSTASKMRPDWLIVGELSGPAVVRALEIFGHGHTGLTTLHATSVEDALGRLEVMCLKANLGLGLGEIRAMIASALRLITFQEKLPSGARKITHMMELRGMENDRYVLCPLFRYSAASGKLEPTGEPPGWA